MCSSDLTAAKVMDKVIGRVQARVNDPEYARQAWQRELDARQRRAQRRLGSAAPSGQPQGQVRQDTPPELPPSVGQGIIDSQVVMAMSTKDCIKLIQEVEAATPAAAPATPTTASTTPDKTELDLLKEIREIGRAHV